MDRNVQGYQALSEKEKQTLRLLLAGHDAKSMANCLGLSVHTINERLRDARRKLSVSSSKEAARLLRAREGGDPHSLGDEPFGAAGADAATQDGGTPHVQPRSKGRAAWAIGGIAMMSMFIGALALLAPAAGPQLATTPQVAAVETATSRAARDWLALVDQGKWNESWAATARSFQSLNTVDAWRSASEKARVPLGALVSRTLIDEQDVPAPPNGYRTVRFRSDYANRRGAIETVSLDREGGAWKVVGIYIE